MVAFFSKKMPETSRPGLPSQKDLFLRSLYPGNHVDLVLVNEEDPDVVEIRSSTIHDITRDRKLIMAQTSPPMLASQIGRPLEVTFVCRLNNDRSETKWLRTTYHTQLTEIIPNYSISDKHETALAVPLPARLEIASLRMHFRVEPKMGDNMSAYWSADNFNKVIDDAVNQFSQQLRRELWLREKHPRRLARELADKLQDTVMQVYDKIADIKQANIKDISEGGAKLIHDRQIKMHPGSTHQLTLLWNNELWEVNVRVVRSGELQPEPHPTRIFTSVQFVSMNIREKQRLAKLMQEMMRKSLADRALDG